MLLNLRLLFAVACLFLYGHCLAAGTKTEEKTKPRLAYKVELNYVQDREGIFTKDKTSVLNSLRVLVQDAISAHRHFPTLAEEGLEEAGKKKAALFLTVNAAVRPISRFVPGAAIGSGDSVPVSVQISLSPIRLTDVPSKESLAKGVEVNVAFDCIGAFYPPAACLAEAVKRAGGPLQEILSFYIGKSSQASYLKKEEAKSLARDREEIKKMVEKAESGALKQVKELLEKSKFDGK